MFTSLFPTVGGDSRDFSPPWDGEHVEISRVEGINPFLPSSRVFFLHLSLNGSVPEAVPKKKRKKICSTILTPYAHEYTYPVDATHPLSPS